MLHHSIIGENKLKVKGFLPIFFNFFSFNSNTQSFFEITCSHIFKKRPTACDNFKTSFYTLLTLFMGGNLNKHPIYCINTVGAIINLPKHFINTKFRADNIRPYKDYLSFKYYQKLSEPNQKPNRIYSESFRTHIKEVPREQNIRLHKPIRHGFNPALPISLQKQSRRRRPLPNHLGKGD